MSTNLRQLRQYAWDMIPCEKVDDFMPVWDMIPGSMDVAEMEHAASHRRLDRVLAVAPDFAEQCAQAAKVATAVIFRLDQNDGAIAEEIIGTVEYQNTVVVYGASLAIIADLMESGLLQEARGV